MGRQLGAISGLAMALIVLNHAIHLGLVVPFDLGYPDLPIRVENFLSILQAFGAYAVPAFLFISGSFVAYAARGEPPQLSRKFLVSSLKHILVPYIIWSLFSYLFYYLKAGSSYTWTDILRNLLVGFPYHFIPLLAFYYAASPVLVRLIRRSPFIVIGLISLYQLFLMNIIYSGVLGFISPEWTRYAAIPVLKQTMADWGIYFPLGMAYGLNSRAFSAWSQKFGWALWIITVGIFVLGMLDGFRIIAVPLARLLSPLPFILIVPGISRGAIPLVKTLEHIGRRSYGLYLTHRLVLELVLIVIQLAIPVLFTLPVLLFPLLFTTGLIIPLWAMDLFARAPTKRVYRYIFG